MPRTRPPTDLDAKLVKAQQRYLGKCARFLTGFDFESATYVDVRKAALAVEMLKSRLDQTSGGDDPMATFMREFFKTEEADPLDVADEHDLPVEDQALKALQGDAPEVRGPLSDEPDPDRAIADALARTEFKDLTSTKPGFPKGTKLGPRKRKRAPTPRSRVTKRDIRGTLRQRWRSKTP